MTDSEPEAGTQLSAEPQAERGAMGSRDTGSDEAAGGPVDRPAGTADGRDSTSIDPQEADHPDASTPAATGH